MGWNYQLYNVLHSVMLAGEKMALGTISCQSIKLEKNLTLFYPQEFSFVSIFILPSSFSKMITYIISSLSNLKK